uniref:Uncharacterized protein n=1 Tax=Gallus gallus TaxID=9031 RepID=A0A8V0ZQZ9_CHICK
SEEHALGGSLGKLEFEACKYSSSMLESLSRQGKAKNTSFVHVGEGRSIGVWDLEAAKILRTLLGHKANICSLDFHPCGSSVASGSLDTAIKLWDVRRKGFRNRHLTDCLYLHSNIACI